MEGIEDVAGMVRPGLEDSCLISPLVRNQREMNTSQLSFFFLCSLRSQPMDGASVFKIGLPSLRYAQRVDPRVILDAVN